MTNIQNVQNGDSAPVVSVNGGDGTGASALATITVGVVTSTLSTLFTDVNGNIATATLDIGSYDKAHGTSTFLDNTPLLVKVTKNDYMNHTHEMKPTMKSQYQVSMNHGPLIFTNEGSCWLI